jgi:hypothetical protein
MRQRLLQLIGFCVVFVASGSIRPVRAQNQQWPNQNPTSGIFISVRRPVVNTAYVMRVVNAAESAYRRNLKRFGSWQELYDSGALWDVQKAEDEWRKVAFAKGPEAVPGYRLSLVVSADGTAYSISLQDTDSNGCGFSLFSDQSGVLYQGAPLGCPESQLARVRVVH